MALSRLILPKTSLHLHRRGFPKLTRWFSSSGNVKSQKLSGSKKSEAAKEQRAVGVKSYVKKYMETHPGFFPKATQVQNKVGGSWYTLKGIVTKLRDKMQGIHQVQNHLLNETSDSTVDTKDSEVTTSYNNPHSSEPKGIVQSSETVLNSHRIEKTISTRATSHRMEESSSKGMVNITASDVIKMHNYADDIVLGKPKSTGQASETIMDSLNDDKYISTSAPSHIMWGASSEDVVGMTASEVSKTHNNSDYTDLGRTESIVPSLEAIMDSQSNEENISISAPSQLIGENSVDDMDQLKDISDSSKLVEPKNGHGQPKEAMSGLLRGFDRDQNTESEHLFCLTHQLLYEPSTTSEKDGAKKLTSVGNEDYKPDKRITTLVQTSNPRSEVGETSAPSGSTQQLKGLANLFKKVNDQAALEKVGKTNDILTPNRVSEDLTETSGEDLPKSFDINSLINCIRELPVEQSPNKSQRNIISNKTDQVSNRDSIRRIRSRANVQKTDDKGRQTSLKEDSISRKSKKFNDSKEPSTKVPFVACTESIIEDGDRSDSVVAAFDHMRPQPSPQVLLPTSKEHPKKTPDTISAETGTNQNKVLVRFLNKYVEYSDIAGALEDCGHIVKICELSSIKGSNFKDAYVYFEAREGLEKALKKSNLRVKNADAIVEATSSVEGMLDRIPIPNLIGDPNAPVALVKNPTRTIMIEQLTHGISSRHLKEALSFCGSGISSFFLGSSSSVAYVEFETEDAKEKAIAKHSIRVLGKQLLIFRMDAPRTTVVRISNIKLEKTMKKVISILASYGQVKCLDRREEEMIDVHFKLEEWPNMLNILNSLNGKKVDGYRWCAQPAPVFPPEILRILWSQSDERRYVKAVMQDLLRKVEENHVDASGLTHLTTKYYREGF